MSEVNDLHKIISNKIYEKLLKDCEDIINTTNDRLNDYKIIAGLLDNIIKIKTIQAMDISKELIAESRGVLRN